MPQRACLRFPVPIAHRTYFTLTAIKCPRASTTAHCGWLDSIAGRTSKGVRYGYSMQRLPVDLYAQATDAASKVLQQRRMPASAATPMAQIETRDRSGLPCQPGQSAKVVGRQEPRLLARLSASPSRLRREQPSIPARPQPTTTRCADCKEQRVTRAKQPARRALRTASAR